MDCAPPYPPVPLRVLWTALTVLSLLGHAPRASAACKLVKRFELPVVMSGLRPMVHARINGTAVLFIADSGAFYNMLTPAAAAELNLRLEPAPDWLILSGVGGAARTWLTVADTFTLVDLTVPRVKFIVAGNELGGGAAGLLGQNVFRLAGDVEYDLANGVIRLFRADDCRKAELAYWANDRPFSVMDIEHATPASPHTTGVAFLNAARIRVMFDTGAATSMLTLEAAKRAGITPGSPGVVPGGTSYGIGRQLVQTWIAPFPSFRIGDEEVRNTHLRVGATSMRHVDMLVGADFFLSHRVYVANGQAKLYFTYNGGPVFDLTSTSPASASSGNASAAAPDAQPQPTGPVVHRDEPGDAAGFSRRGSAFAARRDFEHAIADLTRACELAPAEASYFYQRGQAYWGNRQPDLALADFDRALQLKPDDLQSLLARAELHARREIPAALADLDAADRIAPRGSQARLTMGDLYQDAGQYAAGIAQYTDWIGTHDRDDVRMARALDARCRVRARWGQELAQALADCDLALKLRPDTAAYLDSRGLVRLRRGEYDRAIADYDRALKLQPQSAWSHFGRGVAKLRKGLEAEGQADISAATALQPNIAEEARQYGIVP